VSSLKNRVSLLLRVRAMTITVAAGLPRPLAMVPGAGLEPARLLGSRF
jgi:hypothetical protein